MFGRSDAHAHRRPRSGILIALLATCLAIVGCGGTTAVHHPAAGDMPAATSTAAPAPSSSNAAAASSQQPSSRSAIASKCSASSSGKPAAVMLCLAEHGVKIPTEARLASCLLSATDSTAVNACLTKAGQ
jgi:hypothetical protein